jgi:GMP synthase (glutamine-hydrolysing)
MARLLLMNCIAQDAAREAFDRSIAPHLGGIFGRTAGGDVDVAWLADPSRLPGPDAYSHLIVSGSELSAARRNPRDDELMDVLRAFVETDRRVLGICYGHQMLARAFAGDACCRRAATSEFGWKRLALRPDALFAGVPELVAVHSHHDEVFDLPEPFRVIASTQDCAVQAFRWHDRAAWGTQFHPEQTFETGTAMLEDNLRSEPLAPALFVDDLRDPDVLRHGVRLFENFFGGTTV